MANRGNGLAVAVSALVRLKKGARSWRGARWLPRSTVWILLGCLGLAGCSENQGPGGDGLDPVERVGDGGVGTDGRTPSPFEWTAVLDESFDYEATGIEALTSHEVLSLPPIPLMAGDQGLLSAGAQVQGPEELDQPILVASRISCRMEEESFALGAWTLVNWEGAVRHPEGVRVEVRDVFTAPRNGTYLCSLELLSGAGVGVPPATFMSVLAGAEHTQMTFRKHPASEDARWEALSHADVATGERATVLERSFELLPRATELTVLSDVQMSSCPPTSIERGWGSIEGESSFSHLETRMHVVQLSDDGATICATFRSAEEPSSTLAISNYAHHAKAFHELTFAVDPNCGSTARSWVEVAVVEGNPVRVEDRLATGALTVGGLLVEN